MKLNYECMRDVLIFLEENLTLNCADDGMEYEEMSGEDVCNGLPAYSKEDVYYSLEMLSQGGYINADDLYGDDQLLVCSVLSLNLDGHEFLAQIRDSENWSNVKKVTSAIRNFSLSAISSAAEGVASALISKYFTNHSIN